MLYYILIFEVKNKRKNFFMSFTYVFILKVFKIITFIILKYIYFKIKKLKQRNEKKKTLYK
jgi:hypothetical protein